MAGTSIFKAPAEFKILGLLWGILMVSQDFNTYYLYILLLMTSQNVITCGNFLDYYTYFILANTLICGLIVYPISGYITDITTNYSKRIFLIANSLQFILAATQAVPYLIGFDGGWIIMYILWQLTQIVAVQNNNSLWKIIKQTAEDPFVKQYIYDSSSDSAEHSGELSIINNVGNMGDLVSDILESTLLGILVVLIMFDKNIENLPSFVLSYSFGVIIILNFFLCVVSLYFYGFTLSKKQATDDSYEFDGLIPAEYYSLSISPFKWLKESIKNFYNSKIAFHTFWHCMLLMLFALIVQYPLTLEEVSIIDSSVDNSVATMCGGVLTNLIVIGAMNNACFLVGSILYRLFVVNTSPTTFYKYHYPLCILILLGTTTSIWFIYEANTYLLYLLISVSTIIPYYLGYYDYYLFTERSKGASYGFVMGFYGIITTIITASIQGSYEFKPSFGVILGISGVLLICSLIYTYFLKNLVGFTDRR